MVSTLDTTAEQLKDLDRLYFETYVPKEAALQQALLRLQQEEALFVEVLTGKGGSKQQLQNQIRQQKTQEAEERLRNALLMEDDGDDDDDDDDDDNTRIASVSSKNDQQQLEGQKKDPLLIIDTASI